MSQKDEIDMALFEPIDWQELAGSLGGQVMRLEARVKALQDALGRTIAEIDNHNAHLGERLCTHAPVVIAEDAALLPVECSSLLGAEEGEG